MDKKIIVRAKKEKEHDQIETILNKIFGENRHQRTINLYRKKSPIEGFSLLSSLNKVRDYVIGIIIFLRRILGNINCLLLGHSALNYFFQGRGFRKVLVKKRLEIVKTRRESICYISGKYNYHKEFDLFRLSSKNLKAKTLLYSKLLIKEIKNGSINLLPAKA